MIVREGLINGTQRDSGNWSASLRCFKWHGKRRRKISHVSTGFIRATVFFPTGASMHPGHPIYVFGIIEPPSNISRLVTARTCAAGYANTARDRVRADEYDAYEKFACIIFGRCATYKFRGSRRRYEYFGNQYTRAPKSAQKSRRNAETSPIFWLAWQIAPGTRH